MTSIIDPNGNRLDITPDGFLRSQEGGIGEVSIEGAWVTVESTFTYDERDNKRTETDPLGRTAEWTYDAYDNVLSHTNFEENTTYSTYNERNQVLTTTDSLGNVTTNTYDDRGNLTQTIVEDAAGNLVSQTDNVYDYDLYPQGYLKQTIVTLSDTEEAVTDYEYDDFGNLTVMTDANGHQTTYTYDSNGNQLTEMTTRTLPDGSTETVTTRSEYDGKNRLKKTINALNSETTQTYNEIGKVETSTDANGNITSYEYDALGNVDDFSRLHDRNNGI